MTEVWVSKMSGIIFLVDRTKVYDRCVPVYTEIDGDLELTAYPLGLLEAYFEYVGEL